jgi:hypothetical protein
MLKPHLEQTWKRSNDPQFIDKVSDIVGLFLDPPERALVLCVDEKPPWIAGSLRSPTASCAARPVPAAVPAELRERAGRMVLETFERSSFPSLRPQ